MKHKPASKASAFFWRTGEPTCFAPLQKAATKSARSTRNIEEGRARGETVGTIFGLSRKSDRRREGQA